MIRAFLALTLPDPVIWQIERLQEEIARSFGFDIVSHRLEIYVKRRKKT